MVLTNKKYDETNLEYLHGMSTKVLFSNNAFNGIIVDETILLYSSSSYLGIQNSNLYYIVSKEVDVIEELLNQIDK